MKNSKFIPLYETIYSRFKSGAGFLEGDVVKLKADYKHMEEYKKLAGTLQQRIEMAAESGLNLRVGRLHTPGYSYGQLGTNQLPATHADLFQEMAPGNFGNLVTVPIDILEAIDTGVNLAPIAQKQKRPTKNYQEPTEKGSKLGHVVEGENEDSMTDEQSEIARSQHYIHKKRDGHDGDYKQDRKNTKLPVGSNENDLTKPSTKWKPLPHNKRKPPVLKEANNKRDALLALTEAYAQIWNEDTDVASHDLPTEIDMQGEPAKPNHHNYETEIEEHMVRSEFWDHMSKAPKKECWNEDGSFKNECWAVNEVIAEPEAREETMA